MSVTAVQARLQKVSEFLEASMGVNSVSYMFGTDLLKNFGTDN